MGAGSISVDVMTAEPESAALNKSFEDLAEDYKDRLARPNANYFDAVAAEAQQVAIDARIKQAAEQERAAIVKWLRERSDFNSMYVNSMLGGPNTIFNQGAYAALIGAAIDIDRGDHHKGE